MKANFEAIILKISEILTVFKAMINTDEKDFLSQDSWTGYQQGIQRQLVNLSQDVGSV